MADIKITLELDSTQYEGSLKKVDAATNATAENAKKKTSEMGKAFDDLGKSMEGINKKIEGMSSALIGVGIIEFVKSVMEAGAQATEMAEKFGITTQAMLEINAAAGAVGLSGEKVATMMNKMLIGAQQAADGNMKLRAALDQVGTSTDYLRTHDASEAFMKQVDALAAMEDPAKRAALAQELFGKAARTTNWAELSQQLHETAGTQGENAEAAEKAQQAMLKLNQFVTDVKLAFLGLIEPLLGAGTGLISAKEAAVALTVAFGTFAALKIATMLAGIGEAVVALTAEIWAMVAAENAATFGLGTLVKFAIQLGVGAATALATKYGLDQLTDSIEKNTKAAQKNNEETGKDNKKPKTPALSEKDLNPQAGAEQSLKNQFALMQLTNKLALDRLDLERSLVGASDDVKRSKMAEFDADAAYQKKVLEFENQIAKLRQEQANSRGTVSHAGEIKILQDELKEYKNQSEVIAEKNKLLAQAQMQAQFNRAVAKEELTFQEQLKNLQIEYKEYGMTADEKKLENLKKQYDQAVKNIQLEAVKTYGSDWDTKADAIKKVTQATDELTAAYQKNIDQEKKNIAQSRDFSTAWQGAIKQYQDDATNGAKIADNLFKSFSTNVESYFESLATGGKMKFSDLTNAIITDIIKMEIKAATSSLFSMFSSTSGGGLLGSLTSLFGGGHASGGTIASGTFGLVGENGPELIKGPASVINAPNTADMMGGGGTTTHNYNINAVDAKSVAQLFAENRMTMFGMVEQARRELPMRTR